MRVQCALSDCKNRTKAFLKLVRATKALSCLVSDADAIKVIVSDLNILIFKVSAYDAK